MSSYALRNKRTSGNAKHPHGANDRWVDRYKPRLDFFENNSNNWQYDNCNIKSIPAATNTQNAWLINELI